MTFSEWGKQRKIKVETIQPLTYKNIPTTESAASTGGRLSFSQWGKRQRNQLLKRNTAQNQASNSYPTLSLRASPQTGVAISDLRDKAIVQQELDTVTSELNALEKEYPSAVYSALPTPADLDVDVPMLGPAATGSTLQKEVADYSTRKSALQKRQKALEEELSESIAWQQYCEQSQQYYDNWGHYVEEDWFSEAAASRDYVNPSDEDLAYYDVMMDNKRWETMPDGSLQDAFGNMIPYEADVSGNIIHPMKDDARYVINDPLGMFKSASEEERWQAYSNPTDGNGLKGSKDRILIEGMENHWEQLTGDEENMYYALLKVKGLDTAMEYLNDTAEQRNSRWGKQEVVRINSIEDNFERALKTTELGVSSGTDQWTRGIAQAISGEDLPTSGLQYANAEMQKTLDGFWKYAYQATNAVGNMLPSIAISYLPGGALAASASMGVSAGGNAYGQALSEGYSENQARTYGILVGASETVLQYLIGGISDLGGVGTDALIAKLEIIDNSLLRISGKLGVKIGSEITEEELQNYLEPAFRAIIFGEEYDAPTIDEFMETAIVTALSTGTMEGPSTIANDIITHYTPTEAVYAGSISGMTHAAGHATAVDTGFQNYYDSIIKMEGDMYGAERAAKATYDRRAEADADAGENRTRTADAERPGIQEAVGETGKGFTEVHFPGGQHRGLAATSEDFDAHDYVAIDENTDLGRIQQNLEHDGIECRVVKSTSWKRNAPAYAHNGRVYISQDIDKETLPTVVPHETTHVMKQRGFQQYLKYVEDIPDMLLMGEKETWKLLDIAAKHRRVDISEMSDTDYINLYDEMNAIVYGMYQGGILDDPRYDYGEWIPGAFKDFDGYIRRMDEIHAQFKQQFGPASGVADSKTDNTSEIMSLRFDVSADNSMPLSDRNVLSQVLESTDLQTVDPRLRPVLRDYGRHLQQLKTIEFLQQKQQARITQLQKSGSSANALQTAQRDLTKLEQMHARQEQRLEGLEQKRDLQQFVRENKSRQQYKAIEGAEDQYIAQRNLDKPENGDTIKTGATYGAHTDKSDPLSKKRDAIAADYYEQIRNRDRSYEIIAVARNTGFSESDIDKVFAHVFEKEHLFEDGQVHRFYPNYYMQHSWMRLREGKNIQKHDLTLLNHELAEAHIMEKNPSVTYEQAHQEVSKIYNYAKELREYLENHDA